MTNKTINHPEPNSNHLDQIRGCLVGGAAGDALGYAIEFWGEEQIFKTYGENGITTYKLDDKSHKALISDDTQMSLFTANGLLIRETRGRLRGIAGEPSEYVLKAYENWLLTQTITYEESRKKEYRKYTWLMDVPELYSRRAPGTTCLSALENPKEIYGTYKSFIEAKVNDSKGCGGIMRISPVALHCKSLPIENADMTAADIAAITHGHSLGYMPAAVLSHIISRIIFAKEPMPLKDIVLEARDAASKLFEGDKHLKELEDIINLAVALSENDTPDLQNINRLGEGWVAEETLAIAIYCALRHQDDFSAGIIAAVNHKGDSDSTGAVTGNILGALLGYDAIEEKWKRDLELIDVITEMADDLCHGCKISEYDAYEDPDWERKYVKMRWK